MQDQANDNQILTISYNIIFYINDELIEQISKFKYLGSILNDK